MNPSINGVCQLEACVLGSEMTDEFETKFLLTVDLDRSDVGEALGVARR